MKSVDEVLEHVHQALLGVGPAAATAGAAMGSAALSAAALRQNMMEFLAVRVASACGLPVDVAMERLREFEARYYPGLGGFVEMSRLVVYGYAEPDWSIFVEWML